jgi:Tol biopolymer transport system component
VSENNLQDLLRQGIELAREGNKAEARKRFEQALEIDDRNEKAWYWLAGVVPTREERLFALSQVLQINPNNEKAKQALEQLEAKGGKLQQPEPEVIPGVSRRQLMIFGGGGLAAILLVIGIFLAVVGGRNASVAQETADAQAIIDGQTQAAQTNIAVSTRAAETAIAIASPTPTATATPDRATLPPEFTPTFTATPPVTATPLPPPEGVGGRIYGWGGTDVTQINFFNLGFYTVPGGQFQPLSGERGRVVALNGDGTRMVYTRYFPVTSDYSLEINNVAGNEPRQPLTGQPVVDAEMPNWCRVNNTIVFVGKPTNLGEFSTDLFNVPMQLYMFDLDSNALTPMTNDRLNYSYPAFDPDCTRIVAVKNDPTNLTPGADLILIDVGSRAQTALTNDLNRVTETTPRFSPDGTQIVYTAYEGENTGDNDIVIRPASASGVPILPVPDPTNANDIFPVFSPDGRVLAFASNRNGRYMIFTYDLVSNVLGQLTAGPEDAFPGAWGG